jgi:hypothetical protein
MQGTSASHPDYPRLTLRLGLAGQRNLPHASQQILISKLEDVFSAIEDRLARIFKQGPPDPPTHLYDLESAPLLRLVTGLADGVDQLAAETFLGAAPAGVRREIGAVLPFDAATFCTGSPVRNIDLFEKLRAQCTYVLELDGVWRPKNHVDEHANAMAAQARARAYRQQGAVLVRHCDLFIVVGTRDAELKAGGTSETARSAVELGLPMLWIDSTTAEIRLLRDLEEWLGWEPRRESSSWRELLEGCVNDLVMNPMDSRRRHCLQNEPSQATAYHPDKYHARLLAKMFADAIPKAKIRARLWEKFFALFKKVSSAHPEYREAGPFAAYRRRAADLSAQFIGNYRGSFLLTYGFAAAAVALAAIALYLMVMIHDPSPGLKLKLMTCLVLLAILKLRLLWVIWRITRTANYWGLTELAVDMRYFSERLRPMVFLTPLGSLRPPRLNSEQYATRIDKQSVVDWMTEALIRSLARLPALGDAIDGRTARANPLAALRDRCMPWIEYQRRYHQSNSDSLKRMNQVFERFTGGLNMTVIIIVALDIGMLILEACGYAPNFFDTYRPGALLVSMAAVIPAIVASLNGIIFQSECQRLFDRSSFMMDIFAEHSHFMEALAKDIEADLRSGAQVGSWTLPALLRAEALTRFTIGEAAEWSVLYAKHMSEA